SDDEMEFQLNDRISFMRFCGIDACDKIPDATTIWRFKESLGEKGTRALFDDFEGQMVDAGLRFSSGSIIDASFVEAPRQRNTPEENAYLSK
ncbi:MAG: transposase, partial [Akkermansia sp.]